MVEFSCINGLVDGEVIDRWESSGRIRTKATYKNGVKEGRAEIWSAAAVLESVRYYTNGMAEGVQTDYWPNGEKKYEATYHLGTADGERVMWHENGTLYQRYRVRDSETAARLRALTNNPFAPMTNAPSPAGPLREVSFDSLERRKSAHLYVKGETNVFTGRFIINYPSGKKRSEVDCLHGLPHGLAIDWHESGPMRARWPHSEGKQHGKAEAWDEKNQRTEEAFFVNGQLHGLVTHWGKNGRVILQAESVAGKQNGRLAEWSEDGKLLKLEEVNPPKGL